MQNRGDVTQRLIEPDHRWRTESLDSDGGGILEYLVRYSGTNVEEVLHSRPVPTHLLFLVHALGHDLVDRTLNECR
jgi:hypothetical protein